MPSNKQRRQAAQRHLQRQLERRAELARRRRRNMIVVVTVVALVVVGGAVWLISGIGGDDDAPEATATTTPADPGVVPVPATANPDGTVSCVYAPDGSPAAAGLPPTPEATPADGTVGLVLQTDQGDIPLTLDRAAAPCAAASFTHLASADFLDGSPCHRMVNSPDFGVLQCGDPTGTGAGGPGYRFFEEVTPETSYPRGAVAMAKSAAPGSTGSQFFLVFTDSLLSPDYTVVGTVDDAGLAVLDAIAAAGNDGAFEPSPGGGAPNLPVTITDVAVAP